MDVFSPCVTYNKLQTYEWLRKACYKLDDASHDPKNIHQAFEKALEWGDRIPLGLFYQGDRPTFSDEDAVLKEGPQVKKKLGLSREERTALINSFR